MQVLGYIYWKDRLILFLLSSCWDKEVGNTFIDRKRGKLSIARILAVNKFFSFWQPANFFWKAELSQCHFQMRLLTPKMYCTITFLLHKIFFKSSLVVKDRCTFIPYSKAVCFYIIPWKKSASIFQFRKPHQDVLVFALDKNKEREREGEKLQFLRSFFRDSDFNSCGE